MVRGVLCGIVASFVLGRVAAAELTREQSEIKKLIQFSAKSASELEHRGDVSRSLLEQSRRLMERATSDALPLWLMLRDEPYAYPELRELAGQAVSRVRAHLISVEGPLRNALTNVDSFSGPSNGQHVENLIEDLCATTDPLIATATLQALNVHSSLRAINRTLELYHPNAHLILRQAAAESLATVRVYVRPLAQALAERATQTVDVSELHALARGIVNQCRLELNAGT